MKLEPAHIAQFESFLETIANQTYPEVPSGIHDQISAQMFERFWSQSGLQPGAKILDVGCSLGYDVRYMDQSFLDFPDGSFDAIWCRHCLEHSVFPYFTLSGFNRVVKPGGWL